MGLVALVSMGGHVSVLEASILCWKWEFSSLLVRYLLLDPLAEVDARVCSTALLECLALVVEPPQEGVAFCLACIRKYRMVERSTDLASFFTALWKSAPNRSNVGSLSYFEYFSFSHMWALSLFLEMELRIALLR